MRDARNGQDRQKILQLLVSTMKIISPDVSSINPYQRRLKLQRTNIYPKSVQYWLQCHILPPFSFHSIASLRKERGGGGNEKARKDVFGCGPLQTIFPQLLVKDIGIVALPITLKLSSDGLEMKAMYNHFYKACGILFRDNDDTTIRLTSS